MVLTADIRSGNTIERALGSAQGAVARFRDRLLGIVTGAKPAAKAEQDAAALGAEEVGKLVEDVRAAFNLNFEGATLSRLEYAVAHADIQGVLDAVNASTRHESSEGVSPIFDDIPEADLAFCRDADLLAQYRARLAYWNGLKTEPDGKAIEQRALAQDGSERVTNVTVDFRFRLERLVKLGRTGRRVMREISKGRFDAPVNAAA